MSGAERAAFVDVVAARGSGLIRIGVARDPAQRLRELQVGSPLQLELAHAHACPDRLAAEAIVEELQRRFGGRREHGHWYRMSVGTVRSALANGVTSHHKVDRQIAHSVRSDLGLAHRASRDRNSGDGVDGVDGPR